MRSALGLDQALEELARINDPLVNDLISFIRKSQRGFCRDAREEKGRKTGLPGPRWF
jgi:hypothetical protein